MDFVKMVVGPCGKCDWVPDHSYSAWSDTHSILEEIDMARRKKHGKHTQHRGMDTQSIANAHSIASSQSISHTTLPHFAFGFRMTTTPLSCSCQPTPLLVSSSHLASVDRSTNTLSAFK
jgi:hypothetical protein